MLSSTLALSSAALLLASLTSAAAPAGTAYSRAQIRVGADGSACLAWVDGSTGEVGLGGDNLLIASCSTTESPGRYNQITYSHFNLITGASSRIQIAGTNRCVVAPSGGFTNFGQVQAQPCDDASTNWFITDDQHIAITGGNQCLDLNHPSTGPANPQTYQCVSPNDNQIWIVDGTPVSSTPAPTTTASATAASTATDAPTTTAAPTTTVAPTTSSAPAPTDSSVPTNPGAGSYTQIHPQGNNDYCLTVLSNYHNGDRVFSYPCNHSNGITNVWEINRGSGLVKVRGTNFCLDAGTNPANGVGMKIWQCYPGLYQQTWFYTDDNRIAITGGTQCLDQTDGQLDNIRSQTWQCSTGNTNQIFTTTTSVVTR